MNKIEKILNNEFLIHLIEIINFELKKEELVLNILSLNKGEEVFSKLTFRGVINFTFEKNALRVEELEVVKELEVDVDDVELIRISSNKIFWNLIFNCQNFHMNFVFSEVWECSN